MSQILLLNGPNLNLLGEREPQQYGRQTLEHIVQTARTQAQQAGHRFDALQSNHEGVLIERVHAAAHGNDTDHADFILINPAAFTHTSIALRDAFAAVNIPFIEIHLSNVYQREPFRQHSYFSDLAEGIIAGLGASGYQLAMQYAIERLAAPT